jgi:LacI family transcriptional regulator
VTRTAQLASIKDVAAVAGVSVGTVSNVLNRPDRVGAAIRLRVQQAMAELGFVRNESARQLRSGTSRTLAYVMLDAGNPFFTDVAQGAEGAADDAGLALVLCNSGGAPTREAAHLALMQQQRVQGILVTPVDTDAAVLAEIRDRGTPVVIVDRAPSTASFCSVAVDDVLGGRLAVEHLVDRGHTSVAFVGGPLGLGQVADRLAGARAAWAAAGLPPERLQVLATAALDIAEGRSAGERLSGMPAHSRPTAAFCANDLLALGLLQQAVGAGVRVPEQLALVGYDDIGFAAAAGVPISSVRQPRQELGRAAAELVLDEAADPGHRHRHVLFTPELVARRSTLG